MELSYHGAPVAHIKIVLVSPTFDFTFPKFFEDEGKKEKNFGQFHCFLHMQDY